MGDDAALVQSYHDDNTTEEDNIEVLEMEAQKAKREAKAKHRQIPPFMLKLSSFLEDAKNQHLIRWSENGDSFLVLDEDEFAKTLIPERFKHNKYASFVRQLNMYGFHKQIDLSDNSLRANERKNKTPNEYSNPYFRRGYPDLMWLMSKTKNGDKKKDPQGKHAGKSAEDAGINKDAAPDEAPGQPEMTSSTHAPESILSAGDSSVRKEEMAVIRDELKRLREHQEVISRSINQLQQNNRDVYGQVMLLQNQHDRHQTSINAILNFLANIFRKSLEEQDNTQSVGDILAGMLANQGQRAHQGNVYQTKDGLVGTA